MVVVLVAVLVVVVVVVLIMVVVVVVVVLVVMVVVGLVVVVEVLVVWVVVVVNMVLFGVVKLVNTFCEARSDDREPFRARGSPRRWVHDSPYGSSQVLSWPAGPSQVTTGSYRSRRVRVGPDGSGWVGEGTSV